MNKQEKMIDRLAQKKEREKTMISIYRNNNDDLPINEFCNRKFVRREEIIIKKAVFGGQVYTWAEPKKAGSWAFGGNILYTSNGIFPEFNTPIKLHDRNMLLEK